MNSSRAARRAATMSNAPTTEREIAARFGLRRVGRTWRGDCPTCGYRDAAALLPGRGERPARLWCANGCDLNERSAAPRRGQVTREACEPSRKAQKLWSGAAACRGTPAERYLARRGLAHLVNSPALRFRDDCSHPDERGRFLALIAAVSDHAGRIVAVHRTYLTGDGAKVEGVSARASLGPVSGGMIRLADPEPNKRLVVGEGIESAASCGLLTDQPAWAAISAGNLGWRAVLPAEITQVLIACDRDPPGMRAADAAAARWRAEGRNVSIASPDRLGTDFSDILCGRRGYAR